MLFRSGSGAELLDIACFVGSSIMILSLFLLCHGVTYIGLAYRVCMSGQAEEKKVEKKAILLIQRRRCMSRSLTPYEMNPVALDLRPTKHTSSCQGKHASRLLFPQW